MLNIDIELAEQTFPFQYFVARGLLTCEQLVELIAETPTASTTTIAVEDPRHEKQYRMNLVSLVEADTDTDQVRALPNSWKVLLNDLRDGAFTSWLEVGTGIELRGLLRSIGIYVHRNGDFLSVHKDKPTKAITAILYLNTDWPVDGGGRFQCFSSGPRDGALVAELLPVGGQMLAFKPTDNSWHAVSKIAHPAGEERVTVQIEYWQTTELMGSAYKPIP